MAARPKLRPAGNAPTDRPYRIRSAELGDLAAIAEIERRVFSDPWPEGTFRILLGPFAYVATTAEGRVAGYLFARQAADQAEILNLAVDPAQQRCGLGRQLLTTALADLSRAGARQVFLEVRASNLGAQAFYRRLGFRSLGRRPGYYVRPREDALIFGCELAPS